MSFHLNRRTEFLNRLVAADLPTIVGSAAPYGVRLEQNAGAAGQLYWRVVGIHHLTPDENRGRHAVYVDVLDETGARVRDPNLRLRWGWEGQRADEHADPKPFDKPDHEPAANADLNRGQHLWVQIEGDGLPSERVLNCHTDHADEPGPGGEKWNTSGHHSFYILFQRTRRQGEVQKPDIITQPAGAFRFEVWPTEQQTITQHFGENPADYAQFNLAGHEGIDIAANLGSQIFCVAPGQVKMVQPDPNAHNYGIHVRVQHRDGYETIYAHLQRALVEPGQTVAAGHVLGLADHTGNSRGDHLHLTLKHQGENVAGYPGNIIDPLPFLQPLLNTVVAAAGQDNAVYVRDRIADGSRFQPGAPINQIWTVRNTGATAWGPGYTLACFNDNPLGAPAAISVPPTGPGAEANIAVTFTAPTTPGAYRSDWKLRNPAGQWFGERLWLDIQVEQTVQPPVTGRGNKLGFYLHLSTDQHGMWDAIRRIQPPVLLIHADTANDMLLQEIRRFRAPDAFVIGRLYKDVNTQRQMLESGDPEGQGRAMAEEILNYNFGLATKRGENGRLLIDAWMSLNEAVPGPASQQFSEQPEATARLLHNYDRFQVAFRQKLQERGVEAVAFNFGAGNFGAPEHYLDHFPNTLANYVYLGFHEYGWPTLYPAAGSATSGGSYRRCLEGIRARYGDRHRAIITEAGLTRMYQNPAWGDVGWLNPDATLTEEAYWQSLAWYNEQMTRDAYVLGACLFEVGHHGNWATFRHLGQDNAGQPIGLIDRIVALKDGAQPRGAETKPAAKPRARAILPPITIGGLVTSQGRPVAGATVRLIGTQETLGGVRDAASAANTAVTWTQRVTNFSGSVWNGWQKYVAGDVAGLTYAEFKQLVGLYNPSLAETANQFVAKRTYFLPENPHRAEVVWDRPLVGFAGSIRQGWQQYVENKVVGLSYAAFKQALLAHNPQLKTTDRRFVADERYNLPRNVDQQTYVLSAITGARGRFSFADLPAGDYQLEVRAPGMQPFLTGFAAVDDVQMTATLQPNLAAMSTVASRGTQNDFVRVHGNEFVVNQRPFRFIGVNIRGLVHYGDRRTLEHATEGHRREQLAAAYDMGVRVVRVFLPSMHASSAQTIDRLAQVLALAADFPGLYILPALSNLYADVPFRVPGDEGFYAKVDPNFHADLLNANFFTGGYQQNFLPFARQVVERFRNEPRIFAWEIGNELKLNPISGDLNSDPHVAAFINFKLAVAHQLRQLDPNHLITTGMISTHHAWLHNDALRHRLYASPLFDFLTVHCYNEEYLNDDSKLAETLNKPFIVEEAGFGNKYGGNRSGKVIEDMQRWFGLGARGYMQWGFMATGQDMGDGDGDSGMDRTLHQDWEALFHAYRSKATALAAELPTWVLPEVEKPVAPDWQSGQTVFAQDWLKVRKSPGYVNKPGDDVLGLLAVGAPATILGSSVPQDGLTWWPIRATISTGASIDGWAASANDTQVLLATAAPRAAVARAASRAMTTGIQHAFAQTYVNVRKDPGYVGKPGDHVIGQIPPGAPLIILGGPQAADGLTWWQVRAPLLDESTAEGWVAEVDPSGERLIDSTPPVSTETIPMPGYLGRGFTVGSAATVVAASANLRAAAGLGSGQILATLPRGTKVIVLGGPQSADNIDWMQVEAEVAAGQTGQGWIAIADPGGARLLAPAPVAAEIQVGSPFANQWALTQGWGSNPAFYAQFNYDGVSLKGHNGLDFGTPTGTELLSVDDGQVGRVGFEPDGFGNFLIIEHAWGESLYAHLERIDVAQGTPIRAGQPIGLSGNSGAGTGAHLHFGIRIYPYRRTDGWGGFCDPTPFMDPGNLVAMRALQAQPHPMAPELPGRQRP